MKLFLYIIVIILPVFITISLDYVLFIKEKNIKEITKESIKIFFLITLTNLMLLANLWHIHNVFKVAKLDYIYFAYYLLEGLFLGGLYLLIKYLINHFLIIEKKELKKKGWAITIYVLSIIFFFIGILAINSSIWESTTYYNASPDQIFITIFTPKTGSDPKLVYSFIEWPVLVSVTVTFIFAIFFYERCNVKVKIKDKTKTILSETANRVTSLVFSIAILIGCFTFGIYHLDLDKIFVSYFVPGNLIENNYVDPSEVRINVPTKKRNIIHFYLESIENSYFDESNGGVMKENLMPNLLSLYNEGDNFSHKAKGQGYGGPLKTYGCGFSVASMTNQFFGLPMMVPTQVKQYAKEGKYLPGACGMGDILDKLGYNQTFMIGGDANFSGLRYLFGDHGNFKIMDYNYAKENQMIPSDYNVNWGYEDAKLYEFAKQELIRLSSLDKPFYFVMENADSHNPGFAFNENNEPIFGESDIPSDYAKTIKFSEKDIYNFITWIKEQPFYKDTTIVIIGDHNSMDGTLFKESDPNYIRTTYNLILNPVKELAKTSENRFYNRTWCNMDMMPTILTAAGFKIDGDRLGLGTNLYSNQKTLYEKLGVDKLNEELVYKSKKYNEFAKQKINYKGPNLVSE